MSERLLPEASDGVTFDVISYTMPTKTYKVEYKKDGQIRGYTDEQEAMKQAIYKIIATERYRYLIYSWNYGIELEDLFGKPIPYVYAMLKVRIEEALMADDRITKVYNFEFSHNDGDVLVIFDVDTIFGTLEGLEKVVNNFV